jgi:hypothetical protein
VVEAQLKGTYFLVPNRADTEVYNLFTSTDYILIKILFSRPINILQIFELLFHGRICYECCWIMLLNVLTSYIITICLCCLVVED